MKMRTDIGCMMLREELQALLSGDSFLYMSSLANYIKKIRKVVANFHIFNMSSKLFYWLLV